MVFLSFHLIANSSGQFLDILFDLSPTLKHFLKCPPHHFPWPTFFHISSFPCSRSPLLTQLSLAL